MSWIIEQTELFEEKFRKIIPKNLQHEARKQILKLSENPYNSKPPGYKFFREKKIEKWRIYFLLYENKMVVYFVDVSDKKLQRASINIIKREFHVFKRMIEEKYS